MNCDAYYDESVLKIKLQEEKPSFVIRSLQVNETSLLRDFLYEAIYVPEGVEPPPRSVVDLPELQVYIKDFGDRKDDLCFVAEQEVFFVDKNVIVISTSLRSGSNSQRLAEAFAKGAGFSRIGIAHCISLKEEAMRLKELLVPHFEVIDIDCKIGKLPNTSFLGDQAKGISCNPAAQAFHLAQHHTQLNISVGLCVGHDLVFNQKSHAPVTTLIVKDRQHKHNPYIELKQPAEAVSDK